MTINTYARISSLHKEQKTAERQADARALADWNLNVLLERVKKATESSRELDARLWFMLVAKQPYDEKGGRPGIPSYTASVDAALALVDLFEPTVHTIHHGRTTWNVDLCQPNDATVEYEGEHAQFPLAILAALLKALIARDAAQPQPTESTP